MSRPYGKVPSALFGIEAPAPKKRRDDLHTGLAYGFVIGLALGIVGATFVLCRVAETVCAVIPP